MRQPLHLFALYGQSNMQGAGLLSEFHEVANPRILKLSYEGDCELAREPMHDWSSVEEAYIVGPGIPFARNMLDTFGRDAAIGLIPHARGGTSLSQWEQASNGAYQRILERCRNAQRKGVLRGVLWHQGETDSKSEEQASTYAERFVRFFKQFRKDLRIPDLPVVLGQLGPFMSQNEEYPFADVVNAQLASIPDLLPHSTCVGSIGVTDVGDGLHFDTRSQCEVMAPRYAAAMRALLETSRQESNSVLCH